VSEKSKSSYRLVNLLFTRVPIDNANAIPTTKPPTKWMLDECDPYISRVDDGMIAAQAPQIAATRRRSGDRFFIL